LFLRSPLDSASPSARSRRETHLRPDRRTELLALNHCAYATRDLAIDVLSLQSKKHANPDNDAASIAALLKKTGFDSVDLRNDLGVTELRRAVREFAGAAPDADVALVYCGGHGIEVDGNN